MSDEDEYFTAEEDENDDAAVCPTGFEFKISPNGTTWIVPIDAPMIELSNATHERVGRKRRLLDRQSDRSVVYHAGSSRR